MDFIPQSDSALHTWQKHFITQVLETPAAFGLPKEQSEALAALGLNFVKAYDGFYKAQIVARGQSNLKELARKELIRGIRCIVRQIQACPKVTDKQRAELGITVPGAAQVGPVLSIKTRPKVFVNTGQRLRHTLELRDTESPARRSKPKGVHACEIWMKWGTARTYDEAKDAQEFRLMSITTKSDYVMEFDEEHAGKRVLYLVRWTTNAGVKGPWSEVVESTVVG